MQVETPSIFAKVIQDHLELKERNARLEESMPIGHYKAADPFDNHPLFKTEEQARLEETMDGEDAAVGSESPVARVARRGDRRAGRRPGARRRPLGPQPRLRLGRLTIRGSGPAS